MHKQLYTWSPIDNEYINMNWYMLHHVWMEVQIAKYEFVCKWCHLPWTFPCSHSSSSADRSFLKAIHIPWNVQINTFDLVKILGVSFKDSNDWYSALSSSVMTTKFCEQTSLEYNSGNASWYIAWNTHFCFCSDDIIVNLPGRVLSLPSSTWRSDRKRVS